jgi:hypothetical protein
MPEPAPERWLTYAEAGAALGISPAAARMLAKRSGWARRTPWGAAASQKTRAIGARNSQIGQTSHSANRR